MVVALRSPLPTRPTHQHPLPPAARTKVSWKPIPATLAHSMSFPGAFGILLSNIFRFVMFPTFEHFGGVVVFKWLSDVCVNRSDIFRRVLTSRR